MSMQSIMKVILTVGIIGCIVGQTIAQVPKAEDLPEYVIITTKNTGLIGAIGLTIDYKKSPYKDQLIRLEDYLILKNQNRVRTQTDLLNAMSILGFEYINAFNSSSGSIGVTQGIGSKDSGLTGGSETFRVNIVFRKKEAIR